MHCTKQIDAFFVLELRVDTSTTAEVNQVIFNASEQFAIENEMSW